MLSPDAKKQSLDSDRVEILINEERSWESFANDEIESEAIRGHDFATVSLESWHDGLHVLVGTGQDQYRGQMGNPAFAAVRSLLKTSGEVPDIFAV